MGKEYHSLVDKWLTEDSLFLLSCWSRDGYTFGEMAKKIGVAPETFSNWRRKYPEFKEATEASREYIDYTVENALYKRAVGYRYTESKVTIYPPDKDGNIKTKTEKTEKEIVPDVTACLSWLNNRCPEKWKRNRDNFVNPDSNDSKVTINIVRSKDESQIKASVANDDEEWENEWNSYEDGGSE